MYEKIENGVVINFKIISANTLWKGENKCSYGIKIKSNNTLSVVKNYKYK